MVFTIPSVMNVEEVDARLGTIMVHIRLDHSIGDWLELRVMSSLLVFVNVI